MKRKFSRISGLYFHSIIEDFSLYRIRYLCDLSDGCCSSIVRAFRYCDRDEAGIFDVITSLWKSKLSINGRWYFRSFDYYSKWLVSCFPLTLLKQLLDERIDMIRDQIELGATIILHFIENDRRLRWNLIYYVVKEGGVE